MGSSKSKPDKKVPLNDIEIYQPPAKVIEETKFQDRPNENEDYREKKTYREETMVPAVQRRPKEDLFVKEDGIIKAFKVHPEKRITQNDLTWIGKLKLLKGKDIEAAYARALQVPPEKDSELSTLADQLTSGTGKDVETFNAICRWICANITVDASQKWNDDVTMVLIDRKSDAEGMCKVLEHLCRRVNIECHTLRGLAKGHGYYPGFRLLEKSISECPFLHFWNKVRLQGNWYLLDVAWAAGIYENGNFQRKFDDSHIICDPVAFGWRHLPLEEDNEVSLTDQFIMEPWKSVEFWAKRVVQSLACKLLRIQPLSHTEGIIRTENNKVHLIFHCPFALTFNIKLVDMHAQADLSDYVMIYRSNNDVHVKVYLPAIGSYWLTIEGSPVYTTANVKIEPQILFLYTIMGLCRIPQTPFPKVEGTWGASAMFNDAKFQLLKCRQAQIYSDQGKAVVPLVVPTIQWIPLTYKISYRQDPNKDMRNFIYIERDMNLLNFFIICSDKGQYVLSITIPILNESTSEIVSETCNFLIACKYPGFEVMYPANDGMWGPTEEGYKLGLTFEDPNSTKICHNGVTTVTVAKAKPVDLDFKLITSSDEEYPNCKKCVFVESMGNEIIFHIRIPKVGIYKFEVTGSESESLNKPKIVMAYLIDIRRPYGGDLYSSREATIHGSKPSRGVSSAFIDLELQCNYMESIITAESCPIFIEFTGKACNDLAIVAEMTQEGTVEDIPDEDTSFAMVKSRDQIIFVINVSLGKQMRFTTDQDDGTSMTNHLLTWQTGDLDESKCINYPVEPADDNYGSQGGFASYFGLLKQDSWFMRSENGVFVISQTLLRPLEEKELILELVQNGERAKGAYYAELSGKDIKYKIHTPSAGYWRFTGYIDGIDIFSYLLLATSPCKESGFPYYKGLWGITKYGFQQGVLLSGNTLSSTLNYNNGKATLDFQLKNTEATLKLISYEDGKDLSNTLWIEYGNTSCHVTACPPVRGMFTLLIQEKQNVIGRFLLVAKEPSTLRFPKVIKFFRTCRLFEPKMNPLNENAEYYFELKVPPAVFLELREKYGRWKQSLPHMGGLFKGLVKVKASKSMLVVAFDGKGKEIKLLEFDITKT